MFGFLETIERNTLPSHAFDHLCDFIGAVARIHPLGSGSLATTDLIAIEHAARALANRRISDSIDQTIQEVFSRYRDYRGKEVTFERLFELAEWILEGAIRAKDGGYQDDICATQPRAAGWYWVCKKGWGEEYDPWTPAEWRPESRSWRSSSFSGIPDNEMIVGNALVAPKHLCFPPEVA